MTIEYLRSFKFFDFALFDFTLSFIGVYFLAPLLSKLFLKLRLQISRKSWLLLTVPLSIPIHMLVGTYTPLVESFLNPQGGYVVKAVVIFLTYLGIKEIKTVKK